MPKTTKADAAHIKFLNIKWTCTQCIITILPINCTARTKTGIAPEPKFEAKCGACSGYSYSQRNVRFCDWCESSVHVKCWKENLGCISYCEKIIPGYHAYNHKLFDTLSCKNDLIYNPYSFENFSMQIGNMIDS